MKRPRDDRCRTYIWLIVVAIAVFNLQDQNPPTTSRLHFSLSSFSKYTTLWTSVHALPSDSSSFATKKSVRDESLSSKPRKPKSKPSSPSFRPAKRRQKTAEPPPPTTTTKKKQKKTKSSHSPEPSDDGIGSVDNDNRETQSDGKSMQQIVVESILVPRSINYRFWIRVICGITMIISIQACLKTSGIPFATAVWSVLYNHDQEGRPHMQPSPPTRENFIPSAVEIITAKIIASTNKEILLPPTGLPSWGPVVGVILSTLSFFLLTILLPHWFTSFHVLLDYIQIQFNDDSVDKGNDTAIYDDRTGRIKKGIKVLVRSELDGGAARDGNKLTSTSKSLEICPIHASSSSPSSSSEFPALRQKNAKTKKLRKDTNDATACDSAGTGGVLDDQFVQIQYGHTHPLYFEWNQCRYYFDNKTGNCQWGGPTFHSARLDHLFQWSSIMASSFVPSLRLSTPTLPTSQEQEDQQEVLREMSLQRYGPYNDKGVHVIHLPTMMEAVSARLSSPLVVVQVVGNLLSLLEQGTADTLLSLSQTLSHHYFHARQAIKSAKQLAKEIQDDVQDTSSRLVWVLRPPTPNSANKDRNKPVLKKGKKRAKKNSKTKDDGDKKDWIQIEASHILPGEVFVLTMESSSDHVVIPVDALVLGGQCLTNEAVLTGESVPQSKVPMDFMDYMNNIDSQETGDRESERQPAKEIPRLDIYDHRQSILFAGTTMVHCSTQATNSELLQDADGECKSSSRKMGRDGMPQGVTCLALRTGTYSSKGELLRTLRKGTHVGAISNRQSESDAIRLIASLSAVAVASCLSLFIPEALKLLGGAKPTSSRGRQRKVSGFRRVIQCTRIIVASIPSGLPLALSEVARSCSSRLRKEGDVVCSEPGSLLTAAQVDTVVFDKTGTLTADTQSLYDLVAPESNATSLPATIDLVNMQKLILAGCHSLVQLENNGANSTRSQLSSTVVGDPLDISALQYSSWTYNAAEECYSANSVPSMDSERDQYPSRLWQIKTFPFDPNRRLSSAIVLVEYANRDEKQPEQTDRELRVWKLVKGSPDTMLHRYYGDREFQESYSSQLRNLESRGLRTIALGAADVTNSTSLIKQLFPDGISSDAENLRRARQAGASLHRKDFEDVIYQREIGYQNHAHANNATNYLDFAGFACFDAAIRPSSRRVLQELQRGGINTMMLTGDGMAAALAVAQEVGLIRLSEVAILDVVDDNLVWNYIEESTSLDDKSIAGTCNETEFAKLKPVTIPSIKDVLRRQRRKRCAVAATGRALDFVLTDSKHKSKLSRKLQRCLSQNLGSFNVIARATPVLKKTVISCLRNTCGKKVLMCGDGVNDVSAMKSADVAVALLNGFGAEQSSISNADVDEQRRLQRLTKKKIGSNRSGNPKKSHPESNAAVRRVSASFEKKRKEIIERAFTRQGLSPESDVRQVQFTLADIKDMLLASYQCIQEERRRNAELRKGGGGAARILAKERREMITGSNEDEDTYDSDDSEDDLIAIKPGEASLVASFSCLNPSIDGVDSILRSGVASAACALSIQQTIVLHSLMASFNLASLYRDGFRYGQNMWRVELFFFIFVDRASYLAACSSRPKLPDSVSLRPPTSMFHPAYLFSTVGQALIHLISLTIGAWYGKQLEFKPVEVCNRALQIRSIPLAGAPKRTQLSAAMVAKCASMDLNDEDDDEKVGFFRRPKFIPNYETNVVFILSVIQGAISSVVNHKGKPYYGSFLESRALCRSLGLTVLFAVTCITGSYPLVNRIIEIRNFPSLKSKVAVLAIAALDAAACWAVRLLADYTLLPPPPSKAVGKLSKGRKSGKGNDALLSAAETEEKLLKEESRQNLFELLLLLSAASYMFLESMITSTS